MKKLVVILCAILAAGIVLAVAGMIVYTATGGSDMSKYEQMQQKADVSEVKTIKVKCAIEQINVKAIDGNEIVFDYFEGSKLKHDFTAENGEITMAIKKTSWFWGFWWGFDTSKLIMSVGVPRDFTGEIDVYTETGKVNVADLTNLKRIEAGATTGSVRCENVKAESGKFEATTGSVKLNNAEMTEKFEVKTTTGGIVTENVKCGGDFSAVVTTGSLKCSVDAKTVFLKSTTGGVTFDIRNATSITAKCTTGSVKGIVHGDRKEFDIKSHTTTGKSNLAEAYGNGGKKLEVSTTTGSISVDFTD